MKLIIIFLSTVLAFAYGKPSSFILPIGRTGFLAPVPLQSQFHAQDSFGQYSYGYSDGLSAKQEVRSLDGTTRGSYSYIDAEGKLQSVDYSADNLNGFRVAATNLPQAVQSTQPIVLQPVADTPEVSRAKEAHLVALNEAKLRDAQEQSFTEKAAQKPVELPQPVQDTPEVAKAKAEHLATKKEVELRNSIVTPLIRTIQPGPINYIPFLKTAEYPGAFAYSVNGPFLSSSRFLGTPIVL